MTKIIKMEEEKKDHRDLLKNKEKELVKLEKELQDKKYLVDINTKENKDKLLNFIETKAEWKFTESLGVIESYTRIKDTQFKNKCIKLGSLEIEAIYYFLSKYEAKGLAEAENFVKILKPITRAIEAIRKDQQKRDALNLSINSLKDSIAKEGLKEADNNKKEDNKKEDNEK